MSNKDVDAKQVILAAAFIGVISGLAGLGVSLICEAAASQAIGWFLVVGVTMFFVAVATM